VRRATFARYLTCFAALAYVATPAVAQKDVGEPLEHFFATKSVDGQLRTLEDQVLRIAEDFNADGRPDVALWQARDLASRSGGPVFLYMQRKDGRFAAAGSILVDPETLFRVVPEQDGSGARLLVCNVSAVTRGYAVSGSIVTELARRELPRACTGDAAPVAERLDMARYRANRMQAWIKR
jgi:hypothetical protein